MNKKRRRAQMYKTTNGQRVTLPPGLTAVKRQIPSRELINQQNNALETVLSSREREILQIALSKVTADENT